MTSCDTNLLFPACDSDSPFHEQARDFLAEHAHNDRFCICEQALLELYCLLRNPAVSTPPLDAATATAVIQRFRHNPFWSIVDVVPGAGIMDRVWRRAAATDFAYRRVFDLRMAMTLRHHGVTEFATRNRSDFRRCGFARVWDPLAT